MKQTEMVLQRRKPKIRRAKHTNWHQVAPHKRRTNPVRRRRRHAIARRANPMVPVIVANPFKGLKRRRRHHRVRHVARRTNPARHIRRRRRHRGYTVRHHMKLRRRANPNIGLRMRSWGNYLRIGVFGGAGILVSRAGGYYYVKYISEHVIGAEGKADPKHWRNWVSEALRLLSMGLATIVAERALIKRIGRPEDRSAFLFGGLGEAGRQALGVVLSKVSPKTDRAAFGLDGRGGLGDIQPAGWLGEDGNLYLFNNDGTSQLAGLVDANFLQGIVNPGYLDGPGARDRRYA